MEQYDSCLVTCFSFNSNSSGLYKDSYLLFSWSNALTQLGKSDQDKFAFSVVFLLAHAGKYMYTHTERKMVNGERVEQIIQLTKRQYQVGRVRALSVSLLAMVLVSQSQPCSQCRPVASLIFPHGLQVDALPPRTVSTTTKNCINDHH